MRWSAALSARRDLAEGSDQAMIPIHEVLSRIRWDRDFGRGRFEIGYYDRMAGTIRRVALQEIVFPPAERQVFEMADETGQLQRIPFHRVREVYRNGQLIWKRSPARDSESSRGAGNTMPSR